ncbi:hypothetical protein LPJ81_002344, partial [Coemansia sp. IMI 209127]
QQHQQYYSSTGNQAAADDYYGYQYAAAPKAASPTANTSTAPAGVADYRQPPAASQSKLNQLLHPAEAVSVENNAPVTAVTGNVTGAYAYDQRNGTANAYYGHRTPSSVVATGGHSNKRDIASTDYEEALNKRQRVMPPTAEWQQTPSSHAHYQQQQQQHQTSGYYNQQAGYDYNRAPSGYGTKYASGEYGQVPADGTYQYHGSQNTQPAAGYYGQAKYEYATDDVAGASGAAAVNGEYYQQAADIAPANAMTSQQAAYYRGRGASSSYYQTPAAGYHQRYSQAPGAYAEYVDASGHAGLETGIAMPPPASGSPRQFGQTSSHVQNGASGHGAGWSEYYQQASSSAHYYNGSSRYPQQQAVNGTSVAAQQHQHQQQNQHQHHQHQQHQHQHQQQYVGGSDYYDYNNHHRQPTANGTGHDVYRY